MQRVHKVSEMLGLMLSFEERADTYLFPHNFVILRQTNDYFSYSVIALKQGRSRKEYTLLYIKVYCMRMYECIVVNHNWML